MIGQLDQSDQMIYAPPMTETLLSTDFSEAKAHLSDLMTDVYHAHRPQLVSRHRGKEQMLLVGREDLARMLADQRLGVQVVYDEGEVTLRVPDLGVLGFGDTYEEAAEDLLSELEVYAASYFQNPARYAYTSRASHAGVLMRFAISSSEERRAMLSEAPVGEPSAR